MAFRDDTEALRTKIRGLQEELDAFEEEKRAIEAERRELGGDVEERARVLAGGSHRVWIFVAMFLLPIVGGVVMFTAMGTGTESETMYGRVSGVTGAAPVAEGTRCAVFLNPESDDDSDWNGRLGVICDQRVIYGGGSGGYLVCEWRGGRAWRCVDTDYSQEGGDPAIGFDRRQRSVHVEERRPAWSLDVELTTPPLGLGADR